MSALRARNFCRTHGIIELCLPARSAALAIYLMINPVERQAIRWPPTMVGLRACRYLHSR